jgi:transcriptional regulator with XRE-family HTH domain
MPAQNGTQKRDDLSRYLIEYMERTGRTVRELSRAAVDPVSGVRPSHGWIQDIVNNEKDSPPDLRRLRGLAAAMGVPVDRLARLAAAQWLEVDAVIEVPADDGTTVAVTVDPDMSPEGRERFRRMATDLAKHIEP